MNVLLPAVALLAGCVSYPPAGTFVDALAVYATLCTYGQDVGGMAAEAQSEARKYRIELVPVHLSDNAPKADVFEKWTPAGCDITLVRRDMSAAEAFVSLLFWGRRAETWMPTSKYGPVILVYDGNPDSVRHELLHAFGCDHGEKCATYIERWRFEHGEIL